MSFKSKITLQEQMNRQVPGSANQRSAGRSSIENLLDSVYQTEIASVTPTSASDAAAIPGLPVPANSIITDLGIIVTGELNYDSATLGVKGGFSAGGTDLITTDADALAGAAQVCPVGSGSFVDATYTALLSGDCTPLTGSVGKFYVASDSTVHLTATLSAGGFDGDGELTGIVKYVKLS